MLLLRSANDVEPASDEELSEIVTACRDYLAEVERGGVGPDNKNLYQEGLLRLMGERMPSVLARIGAL